MKTTLKILPLLFGVMLFFTQCEKEADLVQTMNAEAFMNLKAEKAYCNSTEQDLWAGAGQNNTNNGYLVGKVIAEIFIDEDNNDELTLKVEYIIDESWEAIEYHLWVGKEIYGTNGIPRNAAPGRFPFIGATNTIVLSSLGIDADDPIYIAAHAVVANDEAGEADFDALVLPEDVNFSWKLFSHVTPNLESYFEITIGAGSWLEDVYEGWCADSYVGIGDNPRSGTAYSSYDDAFQYEDVSLRPYAFDSPENFPKVNWVLNYDFVGKTSDDGGNFTMGDVQRAIWQLLWDDVAENPPGGVGVFSDARITEILEMADDFDDYMPGCNDDLVLVIVQSEPNRQPVLIKTPVPCKGLEETAWAIGQYTFMDADPIIAKKWGWFFKMAYCEDEVID